jgi:hypothetical protein
MCFRNMEVPAIIGLSAAFVFLAVLLCLIAAGQTTGMDDELPHR